MDNLIKLCEITDTLRHRLVEKSEREVIGPGGKRGRWVTMSGSPVFISGGKPVAGPKGVTGAAPAKKSAEKPASDRSSVGNSIRDTSKINVGKTSLESLESFATQQFKDAGLDVEKELPGFKSNLKALKDKMSHAKDIKRIDMPVIEPKDMEKFAADLRAGRVDIFPPFSKEAIKKYGNPPFAWERTKGKKKMKLGDTEYVGLGVQDDEDQDDVVVAELTHTSVKDLKPLQNEIWTSKLIGNLLAFGKPEQGGRLTDDAPIIVSKEGYILDGHHRFGQAMLADPNLKLKTLRIPLDIETLLKVGRSYGTAVGNKAKK